ncbi:hypothetical protein J6590_076342 [Homalodisca vitripennis]|nr:hypothetical protein J6590_076342 [Homalodisca vitripennis]
MDSFGVTGIFNLCKMKIDAFTEVQSVQRVQEAPVGSNYLGSDLGGYGGGAVPASSCTLILMLNKSHTDSISTRAFTHMCPRPWPAQATVFSGASPEMEEGRPQEDLPASFLQWNNFKVRL